MARSPAETVLSSASDGRRSLYRWLAVSVLIRGGDPGARGRASRVDAGEVTDGKRGDPRARMSAEEVKLSVRDWAVGWRIKIRCCCPAGSLRGRVLFFVATAGCLPALRIAVGCSVESRNSPSSLRRQTPRVRAGVDQEAAVCERVKLSDIRPARVGITGELRVTMTGVSSPPPYSGVSFTMVDPCGWPG